MLLETLALRVTVPNTRTMSIVVIALSVCACATRGAQSSNEASPDGAATAQRVSDVITLAELSDPSLGDQDALSIIRRLRPSFLATRGGAGNSANSPVKGIQVSIGGGPLQSLGALQTIRASEMVEIRYLNAPAAAQAYGTASGAAGVIVIKRK